MGFDISKETISKKRQSLFSGKKKKKKKKKKKNTIFQNIVCWKSYPEC